MNYQKEMRRSIKLECKLEVFPNQYLDVELVSKNGKELTKEICQRKFDELGVSFLFYF